MLPPPVAALHCRHFAKNPMCKPLPARPSVSPHSAAWVAIQSQPGEPSQFASLGVTLDPQPNDRHDTSFPVYHAVSADRSVEHVVHCGGVSFSDYLCNKLHVAGARIRIPLGAFPEGNPDGHLTIEDDAHDRELDFWGASVPDSVAGSRFDVLAGGQCPYDGDGTDCSGSTATNLATSLGAIDPHLLVVAEQSPHGSLPYAIATNAICTSPTWVFPATYSDGSNSDKAPACRNALGKDGRPPEGVRYFLDMSDAKVDATPNAPYVKAILRTLDREHYGGTITDTDWEGARGLAFGFLRDGWEPIAREAGLAPGDHGLPVTTNGIDLAKTLKFCTNGTC